MALSPFSHAVGAEAALTLANATEHLNASAPNAQRSLPSSGAGTTDKLESKATFKLANVTLHVNGSMTDAQLNIDSAGTVGMAMLQAEVDSGVSFTERIGQEIEFEVSTSREVVKNKLILAILEVLGLGVCGIDRCYMGQTCLGITKGVTLGGLCVWAIIDYFAIVITCLSFSDYINAIGIRGRFAPEGCTIAAFWVVLVFLLLKCCCGGYGGAKGYQLVLNKNSPEADIKAVFDELDTNKDGKLGKREIIAALKKLSIREENALDLLSKADKSEGGLEFEEFESFVRSLPGPS